MIIRSNYFFIACITVAMAACASFGLTPPKSFDQQVAYASGVRNGLVEAAASAHDKGQLSDADTAEVQKLGLSAEGFLNSARTLETSDLSTAQAKLKLASSVVTDLQTYLTKRGIQ